MPSRYRRTARAAPPEVGGGARRGDGEAGVPGSIPGRYRCPPKRCWRRRRGADRIVCMSERTIALVTGANKGIGYEIAAGLGALGWSVGVGARDEQRREAAVAKLRAAGVDAFGVPLDVTDDASVTVAAELIEERAGRLDVLVNNAGVT